LAGGWVAAAYAQYFSNHDRFAGNVGYLIQAELMSNLASGQLWKDRMFSPGHRQPQARTLELTTHGQVIGISPRFKKANSPTRIYGQTLG
jgi:hypothetical protein